MRKLSLLFLCLFFLTITAAAQKTPIKHADGAAPNTDESEVKPTAQKTPVKPPVSIAPGTEQARTFAAGQSSLEINGIHISGVAPIEGIDNLVQQTRYRPGNNKTTRIKITREWSNDSAFRDWYKSTLDGKTDRRSISVIFHNDAGEEAGRLNLHDCYPTAYEPPSENSKSSGHATESITISYENFDYKK